MTSSDILLKHILRKDHPCFQADLCNTVWHFILLFSLQASYVEANIRRSKYVLTNLATSSRDGRKERCTLLVRVYDQHVLLSGSIKWIALSSMDQGTTYYGNMGYYTLLFGLFNLPSDSRLWIFGLLSFRWLGEMKLTILWLCPLRGPGGMIMMGVWWERHSKGKLKSGTLRCQ